MSESSHVHGSPAERWRSKAIRQDGHLVGRRMWALQRDRERWRLTNIAHTQSRDYYWPRGVEEADCANWHSHTDRGPSPQPNCSCGLYAFWDLSELIKQQHIGLVTGIVWAWGRTFPGDEGFQAQYMMPVALDWPTCTSGRRDLYGTGIVNPRDPLAGSCGKGAKLATIHSPSYTEDYPEEGDEDWEIGYEWVNCRVQNHLEWLCADHEGELFENSRYQFRVEAETIFQDLERFYEVDILPAGDFVPEEKP